MYPPASKKKEVADALRCLMGPTEVQPGCVKCRLSTNDAVEHEEIWNSWELLEDHIRSDRFTRLLELMELSERQPHLVFHGFETRGMEYVEEVRKQKFGGKSRTKTFAQRWTRSSPKRISIDRGILEWLEQALEQPKVELMPLTPRVYLVRLLHSSN